MDKEIRIDDKIDNIENNEEKIMPKYNISHLVSANKLKAYVRIELIDKQAELVADEIINYLKEYGIVYGIKEQEIKDYCESKDYSKELVAACGLDPINGKDAEIIYDFDTSTDSKFIEEEDGTINFRNLNNVINVKKDDILCHIKPVEDGVDGVDVYGEPIKFKEGKTVSFSSGNNTYISENELELRASTDGCVELKNDKVYVENVYRVNNVDNETGNIDFIGSVVINGDVKAGFSVKAKGDIKIRGMVEGAFIESDSDVVISKGMNGMGKGSIYARGNVTSKYIENAMVVSDKSVYAEALINSEVIAKDSIKLRGHNAAILGGTSKAMNLIYAKTIGNKTNSETNLILDLSEYQKKQAEIEKNNKRNHHLKVDLEKKNKELQEIEEKAALIENSSLDNSNKINIKKQFVLKKIKINNEISEIKRKLNDVVQTDNLADHKIICTGIIYSNTRITIGWMKYNVRQDISYSKIYNDGNDITIVTLNSSDID